MNKVRSRGMESRFESELESAEEVVGAKLNSGRKSQGVQWEKLELGLVVGLGILVIGLGVWGYVFEGQKSQMVKNEIELRLDANDTWLLENGKEAFEQRWNEYENREYGFRFRYPKSLDVQESSDDITLLRLVVDSGKGDYLDGIVIELREAEFGREVENRLAKTVGHVTDKIDNESEVVVGGVGGKRFEYRYGVGQKLEEVYSMVLLPRDGLVYTIEANKELMDEVLDSLVFDTGWVEYENFEFGIWFEYPSEFRVNENIDRDRLYVDIFDQGDQAEGDLDLGNYLFLSLSKYKGGVDTVDDWVQLQAESIDPREPDDWWYDPEGSMETWEYLNSKGVRGWLGDSDAERMRRRVWVFAGKVDGLVVNGSLEMRVQKPVSQEKEEFYVEVFNQLVDSMLLGQSN